MLASRSYVQLAVYIHQIIPYSVRHKGTHCLQFELLPFPDAPFDHDIHITKIQTRPSSPDIYTNTILRKGSQIIKDEKKIAYQSNYISIHYPGEQIYIGESFNFEICLPSIILTKKIEQKFILKVSLFIIVQKEALYVTDASLALDLTTQKINDNVQMIFPHVPFMRADIALRSSFVRHKISLVPSRFLWKPNEDELSQFFNSLLDINQEAENNLVGSILPSLLSAQEIFELTESLERPDDYFLSEVTDNQEERNKLLLEFFDKLEENLIFVWCKFLSAFSARISFLFDTVYKDYLEEYYWDSCIIEQEAQRFLPKSQEIENCDDEDKEENLDDIIEDQCTDIETNETSEYVMLSRNNLIMLANSRREQIIKNGTLHGVVHCTQYQIYATEIPIIVKETITARALEKKQIPKKTKIRDSKLVVMVHGLEANSEEMVSIKNYLQATGFQSYFLLCKSLENKTHESIEEQATLLLSEILDFMQTYDDIYEIDFLAHSLGALVVRAAIELPEFEPLLDRIGTLVSLSSPHLGVYCGNGSLMASGIWLWKTLKASKSLSFSQLTLSDAVDPTDTFLFKLAHKKNIQHFRKIIFVGSEQDKYSPVESSLLRPEEGGNPIYSEMRSAMFQNFNDGNVSIVFMNVSFGQSVTSGISHLIGKSAHVSLLSSDTFLRLFTCSLNPLL